MSRIAISFYIMLLIAPLMGCQSTVVKTHVTSDEPIIQRFAHLTTPSISDAVDQVVGERGFMSHEIKPLVPVKMCGRAVTVRAVPAEVHEPPNYALDLIDESMPGKVLVIKMDGEDGADVAAFGGIMATGSKARGFAGAVLDGGCRDVMEIREMGFPVFTRGIVPSNSVGRYVNMDKNEPINCGGVMVEEGDIICGDADGVVVVPQEYALEVLQKAEELEAKEAITTKAVKQFRSIRKASEVHQRI